MSEYMDGIKRLGLAVIVTERVADVIGRFSTTEKQKEKIQAAVLYELERCEVVIPDDIR